MPVTRTNPEGYEVSRCLELNFMNLHPDDLEAAHSGVYTDWATVTRAQDSEIRISLESEVPGYLDRTELLEIFTLSLVETLIYAAARGYGEVRFSRGPKPHPDLPEFDTDGQVVNDPLRIHPCYFRSTNFDSERGERHDSKQRTAGG